jgi:hypothetical protein
MADEPEECYVEGELVDVSFTIRVAKPVSHEQLEAWVMFELGAGSLPADNPLRTNNLEPWDEDINLDPRGQIGKVVDYDHQLNDKGGQTFKRRYERSPI